MHLSEVVAQPKTKTTATYKDIPPGKRGTLETLKMMRALAHSGKRSLPVRTLATNLVRQLNQKDYAGEARKIQNFVRDNIRYVRDIRGVETLQTPEKTIEIGQGDCDDKSTLVAALLEAIGHPTRFVAMGFNGGNFGHVYVETKIGNKWIATETTEPVELGWIPPGVTSRMVINN